MVTFPKVLLLVGIVAVLSVVQAVLGLPWWAGAPFMFPATFLVLRYQRPRCPTCGGRARWSRTMDADLLTCARHHDIPLGRY